MFLKTMTKKTTPLNSQPFCCPPEWQPFGFGSNAKVTFTTRESYRRDQQMISAAGQARRRRAAPESNLLLRVLTTGDSGVLFSARTDISACFLWVSTGSVGTGSVGTGSVGECHPCGYRFCGDWFCG